MAEASSVDLQARVAELEERLADLERREREERPMRGVLRDLFPPEVRTHLRAAQREQLQAARSFLDHWIERLEGSETPRRRESIQVE